MQNRSRPSKSSPAYFFECGQCRQRIDVEPNQAGSKIDCRCGAKCAVPSIIHLRQADSHEEVVNAHAVGTSPFRQAAPNQASSVPRCPFCSSPLSAGRIIGDRYQLKWLDANTPLNLGIWATGGLPIGRGGFMQFVRPHVWGWRCHPCQKIIVDERA